MSDRSPKWSRGDSKVKLEYYDRLLSKTILEHKHPVTGLLPAFLYADGTPGWARNDAWVRDNVYGVLAIWGVAIAYRRQAETEEDKVKAYQLEQSVVKLMRSLLFCMIRQADKVERFKRNLDRGSALHAKYSISTCSTIVGDWDWGHLQIDATSLYLLMLAQMTAAGLQIVYTLDEVAFVQNLVFYIEESYRIPDYGIWERGDKINHGETELNATSIGMAKAALEAMNDLDLFGSRGGPSSVIHVMFDQVAQCDTKLNSLLPRESSSKEIDAGLLTIISFPAFAVEDQDLIIETRTQIVDKLLGQYGCRRFLRDGYQTVKEDPTRLHYEPAELKLFENIECEWPLFLELLLLDAMIRGDYKAMKKYQERLESVVLQTPEGLEIVPELYLVPENAVHLEKLEPHSQRRIPGPKVQHMWSQSLYILCGLLQGGLLAVGEIDPLNRRLSMMVKPDPLVQVVLLSEDDELCGKLNTKGICTETISQAERDPSCPVKILPSRYLTKIYNHLGVNKKMNLSGRPPYAVGVIGTSQLYSIHSSVMLAFTPQFLDHEAFYLSLDDRLLVDLIRTDLAYLKSNWKLIGRPTMVLPILRSMLGDENLWEKAPLFKLMLTLVSGYTSGVRVQVGHLSGFITTASVKKLHFLDPTEAGEILEIPQFDMKIQHSYMLLQHRDSFVKLRPDLRGQSRSHVYGSIRRSRQTPPSRRRIEHISSKTPLSHQTHLIAAAFERRHSIQADYPLLKTDTMAFPSQESTSNKKGNFDEHSSLEDLIRKLATEGNIYFQADILNHMNNICGKEYTIKLGDKECTVAALLDEVYQKAGGSKLWSLVRHTAGMLQKRVDHLGAAATDLLVRQKHFSVGQPNNHEIHISQPVPSVQLLRKICQVCGNDHSAVALTQEILVYLSMFVRSEPELFQEVLRLRIGLIQNVMVSELSRAMMCSAEDAIERLLDLSPYFLKNLVHLIFSRKEFTVDEIIHRDSIIMDGHLLQMPTRQLSIIAPSKKRLHGNLKKDVKVLGSPVPLRVDSDTEEKHGGQWQRRRRLDGALNRVPPDFYSTVWFILERCHGISIGNQYLPRYPTVQEMTSGELKFALKLEEVLNSLPEPEYRQLVVETLMVLGLVAQSSAQSSFGETTIVVEHLINHAKHLFLVDQRERNGPAVECCCNHVGSCGGPAGVCKYFYGSAPGGGYGTMSYIARAVADQLRGVHKLEDECTIT